MTPIKSQFHVLLELFAEAKRADEKFWQLGQD
jgi:hypothetical protein